MEVDGQQKDEEAKMRITKRFVQSGEKEKLKEFFRFKLLECGWRDAMKQECRVVIRNKGIDHVTVEDLVEEITLQGRALVPGDVKNEILEKIKMFIKKEIEVTSEKSALV
ncbi:unnamed protein product [Peronospora destructor]|uniref:Transcription and mRNA export factor ENY2 n=1 Tax=Peronospora destructor TaxID=86335 RepID=A0AAV0TYS5_9STRA|nr:unnamed protein product [Peronospora destructor]